MGASPLTDRAPGAGKQAEQCQSKERVQLPSLGQAQKGRQNVCMEDSLSGPTDCSDLNDRGQW